MALGLSDDFAGPAGIPVCRGYKSRSCPAGVTAFGSAASYLHYSMKTSRLALLFAAFALIVAPALHAQSRYNLPENFRRALTRAPLNTSTSVTRTTPQGDVTVTTENTFNGTSGSFDTSVILPNANTVSVSGTISVAPGSGASVTGSITGPGGQSTSFTNTATPSAGRITVTSTVTPPNGNTQTRTNTFTPPADANAEEDGWLIALLKRLRLPIPPRG